MKTLSRIAILAVILGAIYFVTIGRDDVYAILEAAQAIIQLIADNYLKK